MLDHRLRLWSNNKTEVDYYRARWDTRHNTFVLESRRFCPPAKMICNKHDIFVSLFDISVLYFSGVVVGSREVENRDIIFFFLGGGSGRIKSIANRLYALDCTDVEVEYLTTYLCLP